MKHVGRKYLKFRCLGSFIRWLNGKELSEEIEIETWRTPEQTYALLVIAKNCAHQHSADTSG